LTFRLRAMIGSMMTNPLRALAAALTLSLAAAGSAHATTIDFTGGTAAMNNGWAGITSNAFTFSDLAVYYADNTPDVLSFYTQVSEGFVGDYYGVGNDVLHSDWSDNATAGDRGILAYKRYGESFDLNSFVLLTNTTNLYGNASGTERVFLHASTDFINSTYIMALPVQDWGFPGITITLGEQFKNIKAFWFTADPGVSFAIDDVVIDEQSAVPEPGGLALFGIGLAGVVLRHRRQ